MSIHYSAPGKLFISGEWAILEVGNFGLVAAVNNRVHVSVEPLSGYDGVSVTAEEFKIHDARAKLISGKLTFMNLDDKSKDVLKLLSMALETAMRFAGEKGREFKPFKISTSSKDTQFEVNGELKKVGFGSSAAVVVAAVAAVLDFLGCDASKEEIYKLATIAHYFAQGKVGSAFDVAASTYGGLFVYRRFDPKWLQEKIDDGIGLPDIVNEKWPGLYIEQMQEFPDFCLAVGWSGESASTTDAINKMQSFKESHASEYNKIMKEISDIAEKFVFSWEKRESET